MRYFFPNGWYQIFKLTLNDDFETFKIEYPQSDQLLSIISSVEVAKCVKSPIMNDLNRFVWERNSLKNRLPIRGYEVEFDFDYYHRLLYFERQSHRFLFKCGLCDLFYFGQYNREYNTEYDNTHPNYFRSSKNVLNSGYCQQIRHLEHWTHPHRCYFPAGYALQDEDGNDYYDAEINISHCQRCDALGMFGRCWQFIKDPFIYNELDYEKYYSTIQDLYLNPEYIHVRTPYCIILIDPIVYFEKHFDSFHILDWNQFINFANNTSWLDFDLESNQCHVDDEQLEFIRGLDYDIGQLSFFIKQEYHVAIIMKSSTSKLFQVHELVYDGFNLFLRKINQSDYSTIWSRS